MYPAGPANSVMGSRQADGSLPVVDFMQLIGGSHLVGAGVNVGLPFSGAAPNLGYTSTLVTAPPLAGDFNGDHVVNAADYTVWRDSLGESGAGLAADADHNGMIDQKDYLVWKTRFGSVYGSAAGVESGAGSASAVPEPASVLLQSWALIILANRRVRRGSTLRARANRLA